jgi:signal transduction histidine kinase/CheY-like chemotaxis protein
VLLDNLPCIALVLKKQTREIVACNEIARTYGAAVGKTCHESIALQGIPCPFCLAPHLWETSSRREIEVEYLGKFWQGIWVPFSEDLYVHYIFEVTERKKAEAEMIKLQTQLQQAMKMEAVGRLAGGVAHDFNNILTAIIGNLSLAQMKLPASDQTSGLLEEAKSAAERAARLTQQLLAFSRKQIIEPKVLAPNDLIAGLEPMIVRLIGEDIELRIVREDGPGSVKVDPGQFEQILVNLAVNARDAMPDGGTLAVETANIEIDRSYCIEHPEAFPGDFVRLTVDDTGCGMDEEVRKHIFEPFFTTKPVGSGTGLGLSTIYGAVQQSGGFIEVESEVGKGTRFRIYLPRVEEATPPRQEELPVPASKEFPGGTETVLLVEDEQSVRNLCASFLDQSGYRVLAASSGEEALDIAKGHKERIDLLLTDVVMPGMNGPELANRLAAIHAETKVLFTSGYTDDAIVRHGVMGDGVDFIGKPYSLSALAIKVREVIGGT